MHTLLVDNSVRKARDLAHGMGGHEATGSAVTTTIFQTELGWMAVAGRDGSLVSIDFGHPSQERAAEMLAARLSRSGFSSQRLQTPHWLRDVALLLERYAEGEPVDFSDVIVDLDHLTPFARRVVAACRNIPRGEVLSYGDLAAYCGSPGAARAVGSVMAKNRYPLVVPCHRVVGAAGSLGGYSAPEGLAMKRRLLAMESMAIGAV
jgi:methylated-DNA-[protein]-cysteine S-methyltransferase